MKRFALLFSLVLSFTAVAATWSGCVGQTVEPAAGYGQETFATPEDAVVRLIDAARQGNVDLLVPLFGPRINDLSAETRERTSGDLQRLAAAYDRQHELIREDDGSVTLICGEKGWDFPAPLIEENGRWRFDADEGAAEIQRRRIARDESSAIATCLACINAQREFYNLSAQRGSPVSAYATSFRSTPGQRDGLYWDDNMGSPRSPLGPMAAEAFESGDLKRDAMTARQAYKGYYYRILTRQSPGAPGGERNYVDASGRMTGGFAFLARPADYGDTGVMTFMVSSEGRVYQKDLGPDTATVEESIQSFDPTGWEETQP